MLIDDLLAAVAGDTPVRHVLVGAHLTVVCSRGCGLASTFASSQPHRRMKVRDAGRLVGKRARDLAEYARSDNPIEAAIGLATINSLLAPDERALEPINGADYLAHLGRGRTVALVGHFPFVTRLRERVGELWVIELDPEDGDHPASAAPSLIPRADVVGITASALVNHTIDGLLGLCRPGAPVILIGPSTPMAPLLFERGVSMLAGVEVTDEAAVLRSVSQGASLQQTAGARHVGWRRPERRQS